MAILVGTGAALWMTSLRASQSPQLVTVDRPARAGDSTNLANFNPALIYQSRVGSVVTIQAVFGQSTGDGTGFAVDDQGHLVTASHVVYDYRDGTGLARALYVNAANGERVSARVVGVDQQSDLAVIKIDPDELKLKPAPWGNSDRVIPGEPVAVIGAPFGNGDSISTGIVSSARRTVKSLLPTGSNIVDAIQVDAPINRGNSGGPVFDARGRVIGVAQQIQTTSGTTQGVAFLVPSITARRAYEQIIRDGRASYAKIGINAESVTPNLARKANLPATTGALVSAVDGPAQDAGLSAGSEEVTFAGKRIRLGDQIISIAGSKVRTADDILRITSRLDVGASVEIVYYRDGERQSATVVTAPRP